MGTEQLSWTGHAQQRGPLAAPRTSMELKQESLLQLRTCGVETISDKSLGREEVEEQVVGGKCREVRP